VTNNLALFAIGDMIHTELRKTSTDQRSDILTGGRTGTIKKQRKMTGNVLHCRPEGSFRAHDENPRERERKGKKTKQRKTNRRKQGYRAFKKYH